MTTVAIDNNNNIQIFKNNNLITFNNQKISVFNNKTSTYDIYNLSKINNVNITNDTSNALLNNINTQLGDLSTITNNNTLANIINNMLTQLTTLDPPTAPTNNISSGSILFNDIHLTQKTISGTLSWTIPGDLTNITHFEGYLSIDQNGTQRELNNIFIVNNTINSIELNNVYIGSNLYILIYTKNINATNIGVLQSTSPGYKLINDLYNVDVQSINFVPVDSLYDKISGTISWVFNTGVDDLFDGVNLYFSTNGISKTTLIESQIVKTTTNKIITNEPFNIMQPYYILIYTYKVINAVVYESKILKTLEINNIYQPTDFNATSLDFVGDLDTVSGTLTGVLTWDFELPKGSIDGVEIYITDTGTVFGDTDNLVAKTTNNSITSFTFKSLNIMIVDPNNAPNTVEARKFILRTYNKHYVNTVTIAKIVIDN